MEFDANRQVTKDQTRYVHDEHMDHLSHSPQGIEYGSFRWREQMMQARIDMFAPIRCLLAGECEERDGKTRSSCERQEDIYRLSNQAHLNLKPYLHGYTKSRADA